MDIVCLLPKILCAKNDKSSSIKVDVGDQEFQSLVQVNGISKLFDLHHTFFDAQTWSVSR